ncbi:MAG: dipeptidyl aminopeptidase/acylaminoacyl peptidase [Patiriisocius sp.]|jgi:dipeptidyl aminopeptidase/acylaminoacyl peptidase
MTKFAFTTLVLFSLFFSIFCVAAQDIEPRRVEGNRTIERIPVLEAKDLARAAQYSNLRSASNSSWHPAGNALLIGTRFSETRQLHLVSSAIGTRQQLTFFNEPIDEANYSPVDNRILYNRDKGGDENYQAFLLDIESGLTRQLTTEGSRNSGLRWSHDGKQFAYMSNREDASRFDVWVSPADQPGQARKLVTGTGFYWVPVDWSRDQTKLLVKQVVSAVDSRPFVVDLKTGEMQRIGDSDKTVSYGGFSDGFFSTDGSSIYLPSDEGTEFNQLRVIDIASGESENLSKAIPWNVSGLAISPNGRSIAFATNEDGISNVYLLDTRNHRYKPVKNLPNGLIYNLDFSPDSKRLAYTLNSATSAADVYVMDIRSSKVTRWTESEIGGLRREDSVRDIGALLDWIKTQKDMDASRIGGIGGSYGGYMVLASMAHYNDQLALGVNSFGVSNFVTFLENTSDYRRDHRRQEYGDKRIPELRRYLNQTAPMNNTEKIKKPLFVLQGANDPRVPASESEQIVRKVRSNGTDVWYVLFDDEGHGFRKKPNQDYRNAALGLFLKQYLQ